MLDDSGGATVVIDETHHQIGETQSRERGSAGRAARDDDRGRRRGIKICFVSQATHLSREVGEPAWFVYCGPYRQNRRERVDCGIGLTIVVEQRTNWNVVASA